jgi:hypothetical protein
MITQEDVRMLLTHVCFHGQDDVTNEKVSLSRQLLLMTPAQRRHKNLQIQEYLSLVFAGKNAITFPEFN